MSAAPRVVVVSRPTELEELLARHATRGQAEFFLRGRGQSLEPIEAAHRAQERALEAVSGAIPLSWRRTRVSRDDLARFVFEPEDIVVAVGQDGLVANAAKYLGGQPVIGVNPDPSRYDGILVRHAAERVGRLLSGCAAGRVALEDRTMVCAELDDGQQLVGLNELFVGHRTHQSARYRIAWGGAEERQSSSGLIVTTGTGATGWARSICMRRSDPPPLPGPTERRLAFLVREAFPSAATGTELAAGIVEAGAELEVTSEMNAGGVIFGDGIEADRIDFHWGMRARLRVAETALRLVV